MSELETRYYESGVISSEYYFLNGKQHRTDGSAVINYYESGAIYCEYYFLNGKRHREDGPAIVRYYESGAIYSEYYFLNGKEATKEQMQEFMFNKQFTIDLEGVLNE